MSRSRTTQRNRLFDLLSSRREISLPEILALGIAQYSARIFELRRLGCEIENRVEHRDGKVLSWFRLVSAPLTFDPPAQQPAPAPSLFGNLSPDRTYSE